MLEFVLNIFEKKLLFKNKLFGIVPLRMAFVKMAIKLKNINSDSVRRIVKLNKTAICDLFNSLSLIRLKK